MRKFVARVDLKADRARRAAGQCRLDRTWLRLVGVATELASELKIMAEWLNWKLWKSAARGPRIPSPLPDGSVVCPEPFMDGRIGEALLHFYDG